MPLSEEEQRILHQIEQQFYESDPQFAQSVRQTSLYRHAFRRLQFAVFGLVGGLAFLVAALQVHVALAFVGFVVMLACAFAIDKYLRAMGRAGIQQVSSSLRAGQITGALGEMRGRFRRERPSSDS